jgi:hypothetical protein
MIWRNLAVLVALGLFTSGVPAQRCKLHEPLAAGDCFRVELSLELTGEMHFKRGDKKKTVPLEASATHHFNERVLSVDKSGQAEKSARVYETAKAKIHVDKHLTEKSLRSERKLQVAQWQNDQLTVYSPAGALFQGELELCSEHFDTLHVAGLLAGKEVAVGDTWKLANSVAQALCHFDGLIEHSLTGKLEQVKDGQAHLSYKGTANGIEAGAMIKLSVEATAEYDLDSKRLTKVVWKQKDEREQGPASPASTVEVTTTLVRTAIKQPDCLSDTALISVPHGMTIPDQHLQLDYHHPKEVYNLLYTRDWQIVSETEEHLVMRLLDRGDFVAQVTLTPWTRALPGKTLTPAQFAEAADRTPGWKPEKEVQVGEVPADKGTKIYRLTQAGQLDGMDVVQNFYHIAFEDGRQLIAAFVMTPKQAERLGVRDLTLVGSIDFAKPK